MDIKGFLCVSLGSSTGNRRACACSEAGFSSQRDDYKTHSSAVRFLWANGLSAKDIHTEIFTVYGRKCLSRKAVHSSAENVSLMTKRLKRRCESD
jgi:hypothetical protein